MLINEYKSKEGEYMENFIDNQLKLHQADACYLYEKKSAKIENAEKQKKKKINDSRWRVCY